MEARVAGRAQDLAGDVPGAGDKRCPRAQVVYPGWTFTTHHTACCPTVTLQAELGLGNWAAASKKKKSQTIICLYPLFLE